MINRCEWAKSEPMISYHDNEWCVPEHNDTKLFEFLLLEGAQAGLSWMTILKRREGYRQAFSNFNVKKISRYNQNDIERLLTDKTIIRNKLKILSAINNAKQFLKVQDEFGSFDKYMWDFVNHKQIKNKFESLKDVPSHTLLSKQISEDLKKRGFTFVGAVICYSFMQAIGMVNDHTRDCFLY